MYNHDKYPEVPERTLSGLDRYAKEGIPPGDFLTAVLENDLANSLGRADRENREAIFGIIDYVYNELPMACWGSPKIVKAWIAEKRSTKTK